MRNIKLIIEYDGSDFLGWQQQIEGRTIQGELVKALFTLSHESPTIYAAGRTDSGVHALGQVANFKLNNLLTVESIKKGLNFYLPRDIQVIAAEEVDDNFHARFSATSREYRYCIVRRVKAIGRNYCWFCKYKLDLEKIKQASEYLLGEHVFSAFSKQSEEETHYLSNVKYIDWRDENEKIIMEICANRFLHNMVRIIVGTMVQVGRGKLQPEDVQKILKNGRREDAGFTVPPNGLFLSKINY
jgi:tRNA pseudouridine38-40 synthase